MPKKEEAAEAPKKSRKKAEKVEPETRGRYVGVLLLILSVLASLVFYFLQ